MVLTHCPQYLMGGLAEIDVEDWKKNTEYDGYTANDDVIVWFWKVYMPNRVVVFEVLPFCRLLVTMTTR